jgi:hypothetical protein
MGNRMKKVFLGCITIILLTTLTIIGGEVAFRIYHYFKNRGNPNIVGTLTLDDKFGWRPAENFIYHGQKSDAGGQKYSVDIQTNRFGFRVFGNAQGEKKRKVLFIGDSFTHAIEVSNNKTYYSLLKDSFPIEVFAFGCGGYGTLQEFMVLDKYVDIIKPDIVVLQYHRNDFINNHYELELRSRRHNNGMQRPYLTLDGQIVNALPKPFSQIRNTINKHSRFIYFIISRIDMINARFKHSVEDIIEEKGLKFRYFRESVDITEKLIKMITARTPADTTIYAFSADDISPYYDEFKRISKENGIHFIEGVPQAIEKAESNGIIVRAFDKRHWNETGHQIAAQVLRQYFENKD